MRRPKIPAMALVIGLITVFVLVACGDGDEAATLSESATVVPTPPTATSLPSATTVPAAVATASPEPTVTPPPTATSRPAAVAQPTTGTVEVRVTDAPPEGVSAIVLTINEIEAHVSGAGDDEGWLTLIEDEREFDLVKVQGL